MDAPFFIVGCPRSGTTLLRNLLRSHPRISIPTESHFIPRFYLAYGHPRNEAAAMELGNRMIASVVAMGWELTCEESEFRGCRTYQQVVSKVFEAFARQEGKPRWGDKTPPYLGDLPIIHQLFPEAKIVHIIRDGRDVALSWLPTEFHPRNMFMAAKLWRHFLIKGRKDGSQLPSSQYLEIRFEQLLKDPRQTMQTVCAFLGEAFDERVLRPTSLTPRRTWGGPPTENGEYQASGVEIVPQDPSKWKKKMSQTDIALFETVAGDVLKELGYELTGHPRPLGLPERLYWEGHQRFHHWGGRLTSLTDANRRRVLREIWMADLRAKWFPASS